eukprot:7802263-Pyramimonas_sp.AAC.1
MCAAAVCKPATSERWCCVASGAEIFLDDVEYAGGPPLQSIQSHVIGNRSYVDGRPAESVDSFPSE